MKIFPSVLFAALCASALCETYALEVESTPPAQATDKQEKGKSDRSHRVVVVPGTSTSLEAICLGVDDLAHLYTQESNGAWHAADVLPNPTASPFCAVVASQDSSKIPRVIVLGRDDGQPGVLKRLPQGGWSAVEPLPNPSKMAFSAVATTAGPNGQCLLPRPERRTTLFVHAGPGDRNLGLCWFPHQPQENSFQRNHNRRPKPRKDSGSAHRPR